MTIDATRSISDLIQFIILGGFGLWLLGIFDKRNVVDQEALINDPDQPPGECSDYCYSSDGGHTYHGRSPLLHDVLKQAFRRRAATTVIGQVAPVTAGGLVAQLDLVPELQRAAARVQANTGNTEVWPGECVDDECRADLAARVATAVDDWADAHGMQPEFYGVREAYIWTREQYEAFLCHEPKMHLPEEKVI